MPAVETAAQQRTLSYRRFDFSCGSLTIRTADAVRTYEVSARNGAVRLLRADGSGVCYTVRGGRCSCKAGVHRGRCKHAAAVAKLAERNHFEEGC